MSKQELESKEWQNIDYTNTTGYKTVKAYNKEGVYHCPQDLNAPNTPGIPKEEFFELQFLRKLDAKIRKDKGPILKKITHMHRKVIPSFDQYGKKQEKEYLYFHGFFSGTTFSGEEDKRVFREGYYKKPIVGKTYKSIKRFDPSTGEDLGEMAVTGNKLEYYYEVPKQKAERVKFIESFIDNSPGTFKDQIHYYYDSPDDEVNAHSDDTFSFEEFVSDSYEQLRKKSHSTGGAKSPGFYHDPQGNLRDKNDQIIVPAKGNQ